MVKRIPSGREILRVGMQVSLSYNPEAKGTIKVLGPEVSDVQIADKRRFVCNNFLRPITRIERIKR